MIESLAAAIEAWAPVAALRQSVLVYPLVNAGHVLGIALLVGTVVALDLRLVGVWRDVRQSDLVRVLVPVAIAGFALAAATGMALFATRASEYLASPLFLAKLGVIAVAGINVVIVRALMRRAVATDAPRLPPRAVDGDAKGTALRVLAALSIALWLSAVLLGRLVGYF